MVLLRGWGKKQDPRLPNCSIPQGCMPFASIVVAKEKPTILRSKSFFLHLEDWTAD